jgi:predicted amidohydrolase
MKTVFRAAAILSFCASICFGVSVPSASSENWRKWSPRDEIAPVFSLDEHGGRSKGPTLKLSATSSSQFGAWRTEISGVQPNRNYRFSAWYRARNIANERRSIIARLEWRNAKGEAVRPPDYALDADKDGEWTQVQLVVPSPENATKVDLQLSLGFAAHAELWWDDISLIEETKAPDRVVHAVTVYHRPRGTKSSAESVEQFCALAEQSAAQKPDVICLPEGITVVGTQKSYYDVAEAIPGPTTERLGKVSKHLHSYLVAGIYERVGSIIYNTAVLMDREGKLAGTYRKTHLPREEWEAGITPGDSYPVFETDFGKVALMICWDLQFPEPCRAMCAKGAELVLLPIWGGSETLAKARAIENSIFLVSSSYDMKSFIVDPAGNVLAEATSPNPVAGADLHLDRVIFQPWLGNMKTRTWKERRPDIPLADLK